MKTSVPVVVTPPAGARPSGSRPLPRRPSSSSSEDVAVKSDEDQYPRQSDYPGHRELTQSTCDSIARVLRGTPTEDEIGMPSRDFNIPVPPRPANPKPRFRRTHGTAGYNAYATCPVLAKVEEVPPSPTSKSMQRECKASRRLRGAVLKGRIEEHKAMSDIGVMPVVMSENLAKRVEQEEPETRLDDLSDTDSEDESEDESECDE
eukprot:gb/GFBE01067309.1/.p1 GENE.gb/GFBE01067309.1/~~gb/GFBE01067309.1/.p1  ORF type:complete len:205 (+),score=21.17 gb/GFBE01067309.1/:1-615(+)